MSWSGRCEFEQDRLILKQAGSVEYAAPEVLTYGMGYGPPADVWSIGCILIELYSGHFLFPTHDDYEHIAMIEKLTSPVPRWMIDRCDNSSYEVA